MPTSRPKTQRKQLASIDGIRPVVTTYKKNINEVTKKPIQKNIEINTKKRGTSIKQKYSAEKEFLSPIEGFDIDISQEEINDKKLDNNNFEEIKDTKKKHHVFRKILIILFVLLVSALIIISIWGNDIISKITGGRSGIGDIINLVTENYTNLEADDNGRTNVLIFGTSGYDMDGTEGDYAHDGAQLTDTIMVVSLDQETGDIAMINLPRDLKAGRTCTATGKINEVYWCNNMDGDDENSGVVALEDKINDVLGIKIQYYVHVNWETLVSVVDAVGGVTVTLDEDIDDSLYTGVVISAGTPTTLNGSEALGLARARHGTESGDFSRGNSQQKILIALKDKILSSGIGLTEAINILNALGDNIRTDISLDEIKTGVHILKDYDLTGMRQIPLLDWNNDIEYVTTAMINNISYVVPSAGENNYLAIQKYVAQKLSNNPVEREGSTIEILNGTETVGLAASEKEKLEDDGFIISSIDDAPDGEYANIEIYMLNEKMTETKEKLSEFYNNVTIKTASDLPKNIYSDADFIIILGEENNTDK